jgi:hypothetical protein
MMALSMDSEAILLEHWPVYLVITLPVCGTARLIAARFPERRLGPTSEWPKFTGIGPMAAQIADL